MKDVPEYVKDTFILSGIVFLVYPIIISIPAMMWIFGGTKDLPTFAMYAFRYAGAGIFLFITVLFIYCAVAGCAEIRSSWRKRKNEQ